MDIALGQSWSSKSFQEAKFTFRKFKLETWNKRKGIETESYRHRLENSNSREILDRSGEDADAETIAHLRKEEICNAIELGQVTLRIRGIRPLNSQMDEEVWLVKIEML